MTISPRIPIVLVSLILLSALATPAAAQDRDVYDGISAEMEDIRGLDLQDPLNIRFITRDELVDELRGDLLTTEDAAAVADNQRVLVAFGFLERDEDPQELYVALLGEQVAGYYDPATDEMVVVLSGDGEELTAIEEVTFAHETVHALQDQTFDLETYTEVRMEGTDDESLAVTALIEGDATLAEVDYLLADMSLARDYLDEIEAPSGEDQLIDTAPTFLVRTLTFPYNEGFLFVEALYEEGGWELVDDAYENPPSTTEQILHPEKYLDGEEAAPVTVPDMSVALGGDWRTIEDNSMGEFIMSILLADSGLGDEQVEAAHTGWGGDSYTAVTNDEDTALAWASEWDSEDDAGEFVGALVEREAERLDADIARDGETVTIDAGDVVVQIAQDGSRVTYLQGPDMATVSTMSATFAG